MTLRTLDLSYIGVYRLWNQDLGTLECSIICGRLTVNPGFDKTSRRSSNATTRQANFANGILTLARNLDLPPLPAVTQYPEHRQLCLYTIDLGLAEEQIKENVMRLACDDQQTEAAFLAVVHSQYKLASESLRTGQLYPSHKALSLALAGYLKGSTNDSWNDIVQFLLQGVDDPYGRAIFAYVRRGDWHDVMNETSLPLHYRVGIALLHFPDSELSQYINSTTAEAIAEGDTEGIPLTGLTELSIYLFETYIRKFSDLQTAVVALSHASPPYFIDPRVTVWRETYRSHMDKWRFYMQRAAFDMQLTQLSAPLNKNNAEGANLSNLPVPPPQIALC